MLYETFRYNESPLYCTDYLPFRTPPGIKVNPCCTLSGAAKYMARPDREKFDKLGRPKIQYIKAKMTLHKDLTRYEIIRLVYAQKGLNSYVRKKGYNERPELIEKYRFIFREERTARESGTEFAYSVTEV